MSKRGILKRTIAGISSAVMLLSVLQTPLTVLAADIELEVTDITSSDTAYWLQYLYDTTNYPQFAIAEGINVTLQTSENGKTTTIMSKTSNLPSTDSIFSENAMYWLDVVRNVSSAKEFQQSFINLKSYVNEYAGSNNSIELTDSNFDIFMSMPSKIEELDLEALPVMSEGTSSELYTYYKSYIRYMYTADMILLNLDFNDLQAKLTSYYDANCKSISGNVPDTYKSILQEYNIYSKKNSTVLNTIFSRTTTDGLSGYFNSLSTLKAYLTKYAGLSADMSYEDYKAVVDSMDNLDGIYRRTTDSAYAFDAICNILMYAYDVTGASESFINDTEFAELYKYYKVAKALASALDSKIDDFYNTLVNDTSINAASYVACTNYADFRSVIDDINSFNVNTVVSHWDDLVETANLRSETDSNNLSSLIPSDYFYEITPFFNLGISAWDNTSIDYYRYSSDYTRGIPSVDSKAAGGSANITQAFNVYTKISKLTSRLQLKAANGGSANYFQQLLYDAGMSEATFSLEKNTSDGKAVTPRIRIIKQDENGMTDVYIASADDTDLGALFTDFKTATGATASYTNQNWAYILQNQLMTTTFADELESYEQQTQGVLESYKLCTGSNYYKSMAITALQKDEGLTGDVKYIIEITHDVIGTGTLEKEDESEDKDGDGFSDKSGDFDYADDGDSGVISPSNPKGLSANGEEVTPYIPEYSLSEYYNGINDVPAASTLSSYVSTVDGKSRTAITSYLSGIKSETDGAGYKPSTVELKVDVTPLWKTVMSSVTTNKTYNRGWVSGSSKYTTYDLGEYTSTDHNIDINTDTSKRVVNSATFDTPTVNTNVTSDLTSTTKLYAVMSQAYGKMNGTGGTPYFKAVQRLLYPIEQYTNDGTSATADLNKLSSLSDSGSRISLDKSFQVYVTNDSVPALTWNFTDAGSIVNQNSTHDTKDKTFQLDYYMWVSRTSEKDGVYIADWINATPTLLNGLIGSTGASTGSLTVTDGTSQYNDYTANALGDYEVDNYDLILNSASVDADFSDWTISKKVVKSEYVWCDEHQVLIPKDKIEDHRYIWYEVKGEGLEWNAVSEDYEETFTYTWDAPSWQTDLVMYSRDSAIYTFDTSDFYADGNTSGYTGGKSGSQYDVDISDSSKKGSDENGDGVNDTSTTIILEGTEGSVYNSFDIESRANDYTDDEGNSQYARNELFHDWYTLVVGGSFISNRARSGGGIHQYGSITQYNGKKTFQWEYGIKTTGLWSKSGEYSSGMSILETVINELINDGYAKDSGTYGVDWEKVKSEIAGTYDPEYLNFTLVFAHTSTGKNALPAGGNPKYLYYCLEAKLKIVIESVEPPVPEPQEAAEKSGWCTHSTSTASGVHTFYTYNDEGEKIPYNVNCSYNTYAGTTCEFDTSGEETITEEQLDYNEPEDADDDWENKRNVITYWHAEVEEGTTIRYEDDNETLYSVQVCDDDFDEVFVYFLMTDYGTSLGGSNYEEPVITYDDNHEGSESNPLQDVIKATAIYDDGNGNETQTPQAISDSHPESNIKEAAAELKAATEEKMKIEPCTCDTAITYCTYGTHKGSKCGSCSHKFTLGTEEEHFYPDEIDNPEYNYTSEEECLKGRLFARWATTDMSGNELTTDAEIAEACLKVTNPSEWVKFENADKVSGLLLSTDGSAEYKEVPTLYTGETIKSNTNAGVIDGDNDEDLTGTDYTGHVTNAPYTYNMSIIRKVITGKTGESNVYPASLTYTVDEVATANIADKDIFGETLKNGTWQSDHLVSGYTYSIVPEVLMTYKTGILPEAAAKAFPDGELSDDTARGQQGSVYVAGYNKYTMSFPMYNKIVLDAAGSTADTVSATVASASAAKSLASSAKGLGNSGNQETPDVYYSGSEINTTTSLKSSDGTSAATMTFTTYILDFDSENQTVKKAWNSSSTENDAINAANNWLSTFVNANGNFEATATTSITFGNSSAYTAYSASNTKDDGVSSTYAVDNKTLKCDTLTSVDTIEFKASSGTKYTSEVESYDVVIRNGRLYSVTVGGTEFNLYGSGEGYKTSDELKAAFTSNTDASSTAVQLYKRYPDVAEAIINMQLAEFAATLDHNMGTEKWNQYESVAALWSSTDKSTNVWSTVQSVKEKVTSASNKWYAEDSTVLTIKKYELSTDLPSAVIASFKLPIDYGYASEADKNNQFKDKTALNAFAEFGISLNVNSSATTAGTNSAVKLADDFSTKITYENGGTHSTTNINKSNYQHENYSYATWDIIGDELTGAALPTGSTTYGSTTFNRVPKQQFILSNVTVNDMY